MRPDLWASREVGGHDPLDARVLPEARPQAGARFDLLRRSRAALGVPPAAAPAVVFVPLGMLLGPGGLNVLSGAVLGHATPLVSIGLAALGVFVGLSLSLRSPVDRRLFGASAAEALTTIAVVSAVFLAGFVVGGAGLSAAVLLFVGALGIGAAASSAGAAEISRAPRHQLASRIADLDDVLPILAGGLLLGLARDGESTTTLMLLVVTMALGVVVATATWLLLESRTSDAERIAFITGMLLIVGGGATYLGLSALLAGMSAGLFWSWAPGGGHERLRNQLSPIQHPVVVLVLIVAGATITFSWIMIALALTFVMARLAGKLAGGRLARRLAGLQTWPSLGVFLLAPGVVGIAFALNVQQVGAGPIDGSLALGVVTIGSILSELLALWLLPIEAERS